MKSLDESKDQSLQKSMWPKIVGLIFLVLITFISYRKIQLNSGLAFGSRAQQIVICLIETSNSQQGCKSQNDEVQIRSLPMGGWELSGSLSSSRQCYAFGNAFSATYPAPVVASVATINGSLIKPHAGSLDEYALHTACNDDATDLRFSIHIPKDVDPESKAIEALYGRT